MSRRLFIGDQEINFFNWIGKELIQEIVGQKIIYFAVSQEATRSDALYGEAIQKTTYEPVEINALVIYNEPEQTVDNFSFDTIYRIQIAFALNELSERDIEPRVGDFVQYGESFYEVLELTKPNLIYGQVDHKQTVRAVCRIARAGQFQVEHIKQAVSNA